MKRTFEVEINDIDVEEFYYSFSYKVLVYQNGELINIMEWEINDDHSWADDIEWRKRELKDIAYDLVFQELF